MGHQTCLACRNWIVFHIDEYPVKAYSRYELRAERCPEAKSASYRWLLVRSVAEKVHDLTSSGGLTRSTHKHNGVYMSS